MLNFATIKESGVSNHYMQYSICFIAYYTCHFLPGRLQYWFNNFFKLWNIFISWRRRSTLYWLALNQHFNSHKPFITSKIKLSSIFFLLQLEEPFITSKIKFSSIFFLGRLPCTQISPRRPKKKRSEWDASARNRKRPTQTGIKIMLKIQGMAFKSQKSKKYTPCLALLRFLNFWDCWTLTQ